MEDQLEDIEIVESLISKISENREHLYGMLKTLQEFRKQAELLLPKKIDYKVRYLLEQRMKTFTDLYGTELAIRKHLDESIKNEITLRNKTENDIEDERRIIEIIARKLEINSQDSKKRGETNG